MTGVQSCALPFSSGCRARRTPPAFWSGLSPSRALCQVEQQYFGAFALFEGDFSRVGGFESVARLDGLSVRGKLAARHVQIGAATGWKLVGRAVGAIEQRCVQQG